MGDWQCGRNFYPLDSARMIIPEGETMATPPTTGAQPLAGADVRYKELTFEIMSLAQQYINEGAGSEEMRNAIRGILALSAGLVNVLQQALQR
jgi:hypothetical protein